MAKKVYEIEREGQMTFFDNYGIAYKDDDSILVDNTDGVYNGNILEFKTNISNVNSVLFQAIKYLSKMRIKGESVPATILLISLNETKVYKFSSKDYKKDIHKIYRGAASKDNSGFVAKDPDATYDYSDMTDSSKVKKLLKEEKEISEMYMPIDIDETCVVGWAERYYRENPNASKGDFLGNDDGTAIQIQGEIRNPKHFKGLINPYKGTSNEPFKFVMDMLNDRLSKKDLGAFYTPKAYAEKACELVKMVIDRVPKGNDYIILDRCAGTGSLEQAIYDTLGKDAASHIICSTYEYWEWCVLYERVGDFVREIIPPTEMNIEYDQGHILNADAMSKEYIENPLIKKYIDDEKCTIILFENPPYQDSSSIYFSETGDGTNKKKTDRAVKFVTSEFKKHLKEFNEVRSSSQELSNLFIWSGFEYYLRQSTDSYIVYSPVKYFKSSGIVKKKFISGFMFNRKHFHASESGISCMLWSNVDDTNTSAFKLEAFDIVQDTIQKSANITVKKVSSTLTNLVKSFKDENDIETNVACKSSGEQYIYEKKGGRRPVYNDNIIGYMEVKSFVIAPLTRFLVRCNLKDGLEKSQGFHLRKSVYMEMLPLWVAKNYDISNWYDKDVVNTSSDGGDAYTKDTDFLKSCLIYTCLSNQNKCLSFLGSDNRMYQNELCFDENSLATKDLKEMIKEMPLDEDEQILIGLWKKILKEARETGKCNPEWNYGVYQISKEINTFNVEGTGKNKKITYDYPTLNGDLESLRTNLKAYYKSHITEKMFKYELLK